MLNHALTRWAAAAAALLTGLALWHFATVLWFENGFRGFVAMAILAGVLAAGAWIVKRFLTDPLIDRLTRGGR